MSGMGRHHGVEGFREFSNQRGIVIRGEGDSVETFFAPFSRAAAMADTAFGADQETRPVGALAPG